MGVQFLHARDYGAHLMSANTLRGGGERLKWMVWLGFGYLFDLRSVFRNCLLKRSLVEVSFTNNILWKCAKDESALCHQRTLRPCFLSITCQKRQLQTLGFVLIHMSRSERLSIFRYPARSIVASPHTIAQMTHELWTRGDFPLRSVGSMVSGLFATFK